MHSGLRDGPLNKILPWGQIELCKAKVQSSARKLFERKICE